MECTAAICRSDLVGLDNGLPNLSSFPKVWAIRVKSFLQFGGVELAIAHIVEHRAESVVIAILLAG
jgi:hypothetical protein